MPLNAEQAGVGRGVGQALRCGGLVVAGGQSRRMGTDKRQLLIEGQTWLQRIVQRLSEVVDPVVVALGEGDSSLPWYPEALVVRDRVLGEGPLRGIEAGLAALQDRCECVFITSCDVPLIRAAVISRMIAALPRDFDAVVVRQAHRAQPFCGVYRVTVLPTITRALVQGERRLYRWLESLQVSWIEGELLRDVDPELESLQDFDTPEEAASWRIHDQ